MSQLRINLCFDSENKDDKEVYDFLMGAGRRKSAIVKDAIKKVNLSNVYWESKQNVRDNELTDRFSEIVKENASVGTEALDEKLNKIIDLLSKGVVVQNQTAADTSADGSEQVNQNHAETRPEKYNDSGISQVSDEMDDDLFASVQGLVF